MRSRAAVVFSFLAVVVIAAGLAVWVLFTSDDGAPPAAVSTHTATSEESAPDAARGRRAVAAVATLVGCVRGGSDGRAMPGARIVAEAADAKPALSRTAVADESGRFRLDALTPRVAWSLRAEADGFASSSITGLLLEPEETRDAGTLWLREVATVAILVLGPDRQPVPGAVLRGHAGPLAESAGDAIPELRGATGDDGRFAASIQPGHWRFRADRDGLAPAGQNSSSRVGPGTHIDVTLRLSRAFALEGTVRDPAGKPLSGVSVAARQDELVGGWWSSKGDAVTTNADGRYRLPSLVAGEAVLQAALEGAHLRRVATLRVPDLDRFDFVLRPGGVVRGRATDASGRGVAGARVTASGQSHGTWAFSSATSRDDGSYEVTGLPDCAEVTVQAYAQGYGSSRPADPKSAVPFALGPGETVTHDLVLVRCARLVGTVTDAEGPLPGVRITVAGGIVTEPWRVEATTDSRGRYVLAGVPAARLLVLAEKAGWWLPEAPDDPVRAVARGEIPDALAVSVPKDGEATRDLVMTRGVVATGRVLSADDDAPLAGVEVTWHADPMRRREWNAQALTAKDGSFRLTGIAPGREVFLQVVTPGVYTQAPQPRFTPEIGHDVEGLEIRARRSDVRATLTAEVRDATGAVPMGVVVEVSVSSPVGRFAVPDDGRLVVELPSFPRYTLHALATASTAEKTVVVDLPKGSAEIHAEIVLEAAASVSGRVVCAGEPVAGAAVVVLPAGRRSLVESMSEGLATRDVLVRAVTDANGAFTVGGVQRGRCTLAAGAAGFTFGSREVSVPTAEAVTIEIGRVADIAGVVEDRDGRGIHGAAVAVYEGQPSPWSRPSGPTTTDASGRFVLRDLGPGAHSVRVETGNSATSILPTDAGPFTAGGDAVRIVVERAATITGRVVEKGGGPLPGTRVIAVSASDDPYDNVAVFTTGDGSFRLVGLRAPSYFLVAGRGDSQMHDGWRVVAVRSGVAADSAEVELVVASVGTISGVLLEADGRPGAARRVVAVRRVAGLRYSDAILAAGDARTDNAGRFRLDDLPSGSYRIVAADLDDERDLLPLAGGDDIATGRDGVMLTLPAIVSLTGRVRDAAGRITPVRRLRFRREGTSRDLDVNVDADGAFRVEKLVAGTYTARAWLGDQNVRPSKQHSLGTFRTDAGDVELRPTD